jgi:DNA-binding response OmpR family regulator
MNRRLGISPIQLRLLIALVEADGAVVTKDGLAWRLFGNCSTDDERVEMHVRRIRRQLVASGCTSRVLANVRGEGYRLMTADQSG